MYHFIIICEFKLELQSGNGKLGCDLCDLDLWPLTLTFCMDLTLVLNLRDWKLRPAYGPETPNLDQNRWCFVPYDLEISWMTLENNRASLLCCFKLCASFRSHRWFQTGDTVRKRPIWVKNRRFLEPCDLEIWHMTLKNNRAPLLYYFKLCASFRSHRWFQTGDTVRKRPIWVKIDDF